MAKRLAIPSKQAQLVIVGPKDSFKASRIQRVTMGTDIPSTTVDELGNSAHVGQVKDIPNVTFSFSAFDAGVKVWSVMTGTSMTAAYPAAGVDIGTLTCVDAILYIKSDTTGAGDYSRSAHAKRLYVRDFTFNYSTDAESTEDYNLVGSEKRWFAYDVIVDKFTSGTTSFTLTQTPIQLANGNYAMSVILDGAYLTEVSGVPATGQYRIVGTTLTTGDSRTAQTLVVYHANQAGNHWADVSDTESAIAVRGRDVKVLIAANSITRVQSVTINGTLNPQPVREMGSRSIIGYQAQVPEVTGTITVMDTDNEMLNLLQYGTVSTSGIVEWTPGEGCTTSGVSLLIKLIDPCDVTSPYTVLKEVYLDQVAVVGDSWASTVNQNATQTFNWKSNTGHLVVYSGAVI